MQDGQDRKNGKKITQLKWPKYQKTKTRDEQNIRYELWFGVWDCKSDLGRS